MATKRKKPVKKAKPTKKAAPKKKPAMKAKAKAAPKKKAAAAKKPAKKPAAKKPAVVKAKTFGFANLTTWKKVPFEEGGDAFDYMAATNDSVAWEDNFGMEPSHLMVHEGDVGVAGPIALDGWKAAKDSQQTAYIVDGNLDVDGSIVFSQSDIMTTLWVTGSMKAKRIACMGTAVLIVNGSLEIGDILITDLEDAGHLIVHGSLAVPTWIDLSQGRVCIELGQQPQTQFLSDYYASIEPAEALPAAAAESATEGDETDDGGETVTPSRLASAPASPALLPALFDDDSPSDQKILEAIRKDAPILA